MRRLRAGTLTAFVILAACGMPNSGAYRDLNTPISASTRFDRQQFAGSWEIVESFGAISATQLVFESSSAAEGVTLSGSGLGEIGGTYREGVQGELIPTAPGRDTLVVMWVDETLETAAVGTVSGSFGVLIDRDGRVPSDKALAARAIFDFYGWDISQLNRI